ncbi:MAG: AAA family ATPase [Sphingomonadaceae bacterium]|nr:AAA family ATPase [Sphingomonadaceae bacterium]
MVDEPVLYRLADVLAAEPEWPVYVCEDEADADALHALGEVATACRGGLSAWRGAHTDALVGRECVILPDNDDACRARAVAVAEQIVAAGGVAVVLELPGLAGHGDVSHWLEVIGNTARLDALARAAGIRGDGGSDVGDQPPVLAALSAPVDSVAWGGVTAADLASRAFDAVTWIVPGVLPEGFALLGGAPKSGKSFAALDVSIAVAGGGMAWGVVACDPRDVLYLALEDSDRRLHGRLHQILPAGQPVPARLHIEFTVPRVGEGFEEQIAEWLDAHPGAGLIVVDVWRAIKPRARRGAANAYDEDAAAASPLLDITKARPGLAILVLHHTRKMAADDPFDTISGTNGLTGVPDSLYVLSSTGDDARLSGKGREFEQFERVMLRDRNTGGWRLGGDAREVAKTGERQAVLDALAAARGAPLSTAVIASATGKSAANVSKLLKKLVIDGTAECVAYGRYRAKWLNRENYHRETA